MTSKNAVPVILKYDGNDRYFTDDNFVCQVINGANTLLFSLNKAQSAKRSLAYYIFNSDKSLSFSDKSNFPDYIFLPAQGYILTDKGVSGFDFELKLFTCSVDKHEAGYTVGITELTDREITQELWDTVNVNLRNMRNKFHESVMNETVPSAKSGDFDLGIKKVLRRYGGTAFLDIAPGDEDHIYINLNEFGRTKQIQKAGGLLEHYTVENLQNMDVEDIDSLLYRKYTGDKHFVIVKPVEWQHDIKAEMWLKTRVQYRYPFDSASIATDYPLLYGSLRQEDDMWRGFEQLDEMPSDGRLGEKEMFVPVCHHLNNSRQNYYGIEKGIFQFTIRENGLSPFLGPKHEYLLCDIKSCVDTFGVSFVRHGNHEYFAMYKFNGLKRFKCNVYAHYTFHSFTSLFQLIVKNKEKARADLYTALLYAYHYHSSRYGLTSSSVDDAVFNDLYSR